MHIQETDYFENENFNPEIFETDIIYSLDEYFNSNGEPLQRKGRSSSEKLTKKLTKKLSKKLTKKANKLLKDKQSKKKMKDLAKKMMGKNKNKVNKFNYLNQGKETRAANVDEENDVFRFVFRFVLIFVR